MEGEEEKKEGGETADESPKEETPKKSGPSFFSRIRSGFDKAVLEDKLKSAYRNSHTEFEYYVYGDDSIFSGSSVYGILEEDTLTYYGEDQMPLGSIVIDTKTNKAYAVASERAVASITIPLDGTDYTRNGSSVKLDSDVTEVKVIKAGKRYFLCK